MGMRVFSALIVNTTFATVLTHLHFSQLASAASRHTAFVRLLPRRVKQQKCYSHVVEEATNSDGIDKKSRNHYTTALLKVAYDGTGFRGWTATNEAPQSHESVATRRRRSGEGGGRGEAGHAPPRATPRRRQSRRSRTLQRKGFGHGRNGRVRSVAGTIRDALAKIYGDVGPRRIRIDACSRTDAGVHATSLVAQFYCLAAEPSGEAREHWPRPVSTDDVAGFLPLPFESDLAKLVFVLNRMLPPDVRIVAASPLPRLLHSTPNVDGSSPNVDGNIPVFHPTLRGKTYAYRFAIGPVHDPLRSRYAWHLDGSSNRAVGMNGERFRLDRALQAARAFVDSADGRVESDAAPPRDYGAFRSAFRGTERGRVQSTACKLWRCEIQPERAERPPSWEREAPRESDAVNIGGRQRGGQLRRTATGAGAESSGWSGGPQTFTVVIAGDRFLYKMVRNIVGAIVAVGCGHLEPEDVRRALDTGRWGGKLRGEEISNEDGGEIAGETAALSLEANDESRTIRRICAPARGLTLTAVHYPEDIGFDWQTG